MTRFALPAPVARALAAARSFARGAGAVVVVVFGVCLASWCSGCGTASAEVRTAYAVEQAACLAHERAIVDRPGTTEEQDRADLAAERARCDAELRAIYQEPSQ